MKFIVIDGLDGCGKDTQSKLIKNKYESQGKKVTIRSHPTKDNKWGISSKKCLLKTGKINHIKATIYYIFDILRSLQIYYNDKVDVLIFVRYSLAVAYVPYPLGEYLYKIICLLLPTSEYMFFIDVEPEELMNRLVERGENLEMFENINSLKETQYKAKKVTFNWNVIDGNQSIDTIHNIISNILNNSFK